jgi:hypothetical protein
MPTLREMIQELVDTQRAMGAAADAARRDGSRKADLVAARRRFGDHVLVITKAIDQDPRMRSDADLAREFRERFSAMRSKVAIHQAKWPAVLLDTANDEFIASAAAVRESNRTFAAWALGVLK